MTREEIEKEINQSCAYFEESDTAKEITEAIIKLQNKGVSDEELVNVARTCIHKTADTFGA